MQEMQKWKSHAKLNITKVSRVSWCKYVLIDRTEKEEKINVIDDIIAIDALEEVFRVHKLNV